MTQLRHASRIPDPTTELIDRLPFGLRPDWQKRAACRGYAFTHPEIKFWTERGESTAAAQEVCARCPVRQECWDFKMNLGSGYSAGGGIWGGTSEHGRRGKHAGDPLPPIIIGRKKEKTPETGSGVDPERS